MKKVVVKAREVVADIKSGRTDAELAEKYGLSPKSLLSLKQQLLARNLLKPEDLQPASGGLCSVGAGKRLNVQQFLQDFRLRPDDLFLMEKYSLVPQELAWVYRTLVEKRLLSEYECECRDVKAQELMREEAPCEAASDMVATVERRVGTRAAIVPSNAEQELPESFFQDYSGKKIDRPTPDFTSDVPNEVGPPVQSSLTTPPRPASTVVEVVTTEFCPRCSAPKSRDSLDSCLQCGVVFAKLEAKTGVVSVSIWKGNRRDN